MLAQTIYENLWNQQYEYGEEICSNLNIKLNP